MLWKREASLALAEERRNSYKISFVICGGRKLKPEDTRRRENLIEVDFKEMGRESVDWIHLAQYRFQRRTS
jgi:hypothetical protein